MPAATARISIVIAVLDGADSLRRCLDSVSTQDYGDVELVVIDGGSRDSSVDILRAYEGIISHWESKPDSGIYHAWNKGVARTCGDWVHFLGSDDVFFAPDVLSRVAEKLLTCPPDTRIAYGRVAVMSEQGDVIEVVGKPWSEAQRRMRIGMPIPFPGAFLHRSLFHVRGEFDESFQVSGDYEWLQRELIHRPPVFLDDVVVTLMTAGGKSSSRDHRILRCLEDARARKLHGIFPYPAAWCWEFAKVCLYRLVEKTLGKRAALSAQNAYRGLVGRPCSR